MSVVPFNISCRNINQTLLHVLFYVGISTHKLFVFSLQVSWNVIQLTIQVLVMQIIATQTVSQDYRISCFLLNDVRSLLVLIYEHNRENPTENYNNFYKSLFNVMQAPPNDKNTIFSLRKFYFLDFPSPVRNTVTWSSS